MVKRICEVCFNEFSVSPSDVKYGWGRFCSIKCRGLAQRKYNEIEIKDNHAEIIIKSPKFGEQRALIDLDDVERCKEYTWTLNYVKALNDFYVFATKPLPKEQQHGNTRQEQIKLHRFIMNCPDNLVVDHINHKCLDNRKSNLKVCTQFENIKNNKNNKSGYVGVIWDKERNKWRASIMVNYKTKFIGRFDKKEDAIKARQEAEQKYFGV